MKSNAVKNMLVAATVCSLSLSLFSACSKDGDDYSVSVDKKEITLSSEVNSQTFKIISEGEWHIDAPGLEKSLGGTTGTTDWYSIDRVFGTGNSTITIELLPETQSRAFVNPGSQTSGKESGSTVLTIIGKHNQTTINLKRQAAEK